MVGASSDLLSAAATAWTSITACATALSTSLCLSFPDCIDKMVLLYAGGQNYFHH